MTSRDLHLILLQAAASPLGLVVEALGDRDLLRQQFYAARKASGDPSLDGLQFRLSPLSESELWIVNAPKAQRDALDKELNGHAT